MKKLLCAVLVLLCVFCAFAEENANPLVVNLGSDSAPNYVTIGSVPNGPEGYELSGVGYVRDENLPTYQFRTEDENAAAQYISYQTAVNGAEALAAAYVERAAGVFTVIAMDEIKEIEVGGKKAYLIVLDYFSNFSGEKPYNQTAVIYMDCPAEGRSVCVTAGNLFADEESFVSREDIAAIALAAAETAVFAE